MSLGEVWSCKSGPFGTWNHYALVNQTLNHVTVGVYDPGEIQPWEYRILEGHGNTGLPENI